MWSPTRNTDKRGTVLIEEGWGWGGAARGPLLGKPLRSHMVNYGPFCWTQSSKKTWKNTGLCKKIKTSMHLFIHPSFCPHNIYWVPTTCEILCWILEWEVIRNSMENVKRRHRSTHQGVHILGGVSPQRSIAQGRKAKCHERVSD